MQTGYVIGDWLSDIQAAAVHHLYLIGVKFDFLQESGLIQVDYIVEHFEDILPIINKLSKVLWMGLGRNLIVCIVMN